MSPHIVRSGNQRVEWLISGIGIDDEELAIAKIADAGDEPRTEGMEHGERRFRRAGRIGSMLMDFDGTFVVKQAVEHVGCFTFGRLDHPGEKGGAAVGHEAIDRCACPSL